MNIRRSPSSLCAEKVVYEAMLIMKEISSPVYYKTLIKLLPTRCSFTKWELTTVGRLERPRWQVSLLFFVIHYCMAGFIVKNRGFWEITPCGITAIDNGAGYCYMMAEQAFKHWKKRKALSS